MPLIDSHCHLDFAAFDADRAALWQQCQSSGLEALIIPGVSPAQWPKAAQLCEELPGLHWAAGLHPWWVSGTQISPDELGEQLARQLHHQHCVAIGECGLDALIDCALEDQQRFLEVQLQLACEHHRPLILHVRKAHPQLQALLRYYRPPAGGVVHGFSGSRELGESYWKLGFHLGIGGTIIYFSVADCATEESRVEAAGGKVIRPKFSIGEFGWVSLLQDTEGNMVGLNSMK